MQQSVTVIFSLKIWTFTIFFRNWIERTIWHYYMYDVFEIMSWPFYILCNNCWFEYRISLYKAITLYELYYSSATLHIPPVFTSNKSRVCTKSKLVHFQWWSENFLFTKFGSMSKYGVVIAVKSKIEGEGTKIRKNPEMQKPRK